MAGSREHRVISSFYCINCGKRGIPVWRERAHMRKQEHRKALYCVTCKMKINHVEIRTAEEEKEFLKAYAEGKYAEEAAASVAYAKEHHGGVE